MPVGINTQTQNQVSNSSPYPDGIVSTTFYNKVKYPNRATVAYMGHSYADRTSDQDWQFGSPTQGFTGNANSFSCSPFEQAMFKMGYPLDVISNLGRDGWTSTQVLQYQLQPILNLNPGFVWLQCVSNDPFNGIPPATTISNLTTMITALTNAGIIVLTGSEYPRTGSSGQPAQWTAQVCNWLKDYARKNPGIIYVDCYDYFSLLTSEANGYNAVPNSAFMLNEGGNFIHPNAAGSQLAANAWVKALSPFIPPKPTYVDIGSDGGTNGDILNLIRDPKILGTGGTFGTGVSGTAASGTFSQRSVGAALTGVASVVTRASIGSLFTQAANNGGFGFDDGKQGNVQRIALSGAAAANELIEYSCFPQASRAFVNGDGPWVAEAEVGWNPTSGALNQLHLRFYNNTNTTSVTVNRMTTAVATDYLNATGRYYGVLRTRPFYTPTIAGGQSSVGVIMGTSVGAIGDVYIGNISLRKVQF